MKQIFLSGLLLFSVTCIYAQRYQVTNGTGFNEDTWAVVEDPVIGRYVTIGNAVNADGLSRAWIASYTPTGTMVTSAIATNGRRIIARDICLAPRDSTNAATTYYITGWTQSFVNDVAVNRMFVGRILLSGAFIWYKESPGIGVSGSSPNAEEGVAIALASNGDAVAVGHTMMPAEGNFPAGPRIKLARFTSGGAVVWSNVYNQTGNWKVREIANGVPAGTNCAASPTTMPGEFIITGEVAFPTSTGATGTPRTFAALYTGGGTECWKNVYPSSITTVKPAITGDAGYDVLYRAGTSTTASGYVIAGVAETGTNRASSTSTPYFLQISVTGALVSGAVYLKPDSTPIGAYPRSIANGSTTSQIVVAGPDFSGNKVFLGLMTTVGATATISRFVGFGTANSVTQPFWFSDAPPEGVLYSKLSAIPGFVISTNAATGAFGNGDGQLIKADISGATPVGCYAIRTPYSSISAGAVTGAASAPTAQLTWESGQMTNSSYAIQQKFCKDTCTVTSSYTYAQSGSSVNFTGSGTGNGTITYLWSFGDGTTSTLQNPSHTYSAVGTYNACLTVKNLNGSADTCKSTTCKTITVNGCDVHASFTYRTACKYKISFLNTSTGTAPLNYKWYFDDGTTSTDASPVKTFATCGKHNTYLVTCNTVCCDTFTLSVDIACCEVKSEFCLIDSGKNVLLSYDTTMNTSSTTYTVYVDGVATSWSANTYKQLAAGLHTICLKASNSICPGDTCCSTCCKTINVVSPCAMVADFWYQLQTGNYVVFINKSTPSSATNRWDFGDFIISTNINPGHTFTSAGTYNVCLTTTSINGTDTCRSKTCRKILIEERCKSSADFTTRYCKATPLTVDFVNLSSTGANYTWNFGDNVSSVTTNPSHTYTSPGSYIVCLTAKFSEYCWSTTCYRVVVSTVSCDSSCSKLPAPPVYTRDSVGVRNFVSNPMVLISSVSSDNAVSVNNKQATDGRAITASEVDDKLSIFPNPASQKLQVTYNGAAKSITEVTVINGLGSIVYTKTIKVEKGMNQFQIPLQTFATGNYFLKLNSEGKIKSAMFSVKH